MLVLCLSLISTSCTKSKLKGYEWLEGEWLSDEALVIITPQYYQMIGELWDDDTVNRSNAEMRVYKIKTVHNDFLGNLKGLVEKMAM